MKSQWHQGELSRRRARGTLAKRSQCDARRAASGEASSLFLERGAGILVGTAGVDAAFGFVVDLALQLFVVFCSATDVAWAVGPSFELVGGEDDGVLMLAFSAAPADLSDDCCCFVLICVVLTHHVWNSSSTRRGFALSGHLGGDVVTCVFQSPPRHMAFMCAWRGLHLYMAWAQQIK